MDEKNFNMVFHLNLLSTSKPCFKSLQIILVFIINYLTILFHTEATICSFFITYVNFHTCPFVHFFFFSQAVQLCATDPILYHRCISQFLDVHGSDVGQMSSFC